MAISSNRGIDDWMFTEENLSNEFIVRFLESIKESNCGPVVVFLYNASYHRSKRTVKRAFELGIQLVFNAAYSP